jgi:hypothetical protein
MVRLSEDSIIGWLYGLRWMPGDCLKFGWLKGLMVGCWLVELLNDRIVGWLDG